MKIAILATGDEIVLGDVLNTNARFIAQSLQSEGFPPALHMACCDSEKQMLDCLEWLVPRHDMIIFTGGLGPTSDDKTRFVLSMFTGEPLIEHAQALSHIQSRLDGLGIAMNEGNRQQALFPENTQLFPNPHGSAFGGCYSFKGKQFVLLPGPPRECIPMFNNYVLPLLQSFTKTDKILLRWRLFGIAESVLGHMMEKAVADLDCETGYRWDPPYVEFKIRCAPALVESIKTIVDPLVEPYIISSVEQKASECLREFLLHKKETIVIHDKATGGLLQTLIQRPENEAFLSFNASENPDIWQVNIKGLDAYWTDKKEGDLILHLTVRNKGQVREDEYKIPHFSALILRYAAEWVCFRVAGLMKELVNAHSEKPSSGTF